MYEKLTWIKVQQSHLYKDGKIHLIQLPEKTFCLLYDNEWHAFASKCPHASAPLVTGWCEDDKIVCPYHRRTYDLSNGRGGEGQGDFLKIYPLKIEADEVYIGVEKSFWQRIF